MQIVLSIGGVVAMIMGATLLSLINIKPRRQPARNRRLLSEDRTTTVMPQLAR
jgi:hypothetical protein